MSEFESRDHLEAFLKQLEDKRTELELEKPDTLRLLSELYGTNAATDEAVGRAALPKEFERLRHIVDFYDAESTRAREAGALWSMCLMTSAHLETTLLMLAYLAQGEVLDSEIFSTRKYQEGQPKISQLSLKELIDIGIHFAWLPATLISPQWRNYTTSKKKEMQRVCQISNLPDEPGYALVRFLQGIRNSIHPSRFVNGLGTFTIDDLESACVMADAAYVEIRPSLLKAMLSLSGNLKVRRPLTVLTSNVISSM